MGFEFLEKCRRCGGKLDIVRTVIHGGSSQWRYHCVDCDELNGTAIAKETAFNLHYGEPPLFKPKTEPDLFG